MRVLVSGATGFIGTALCSSLVGDGHQVIALSRNAESARSKLPGVSEIHTWKDVISPPPSVAVEGADAVVNLLGESIRGLWTSSRKKALYDSRIKSTKSIVKAMAGLPSRPKVLISASAVGYYGDRGDEVITEACPPGSGFLSELCVDWESAAMKASDHGTRVVTLRIPPVLGADGGMLPALLPVAKLGLFGRLGSGAQWWPWAHIEDITGIARFALANELEGPFNAVSPNPVCQKNFAQTLGRLLNRPSFIRVPASLLGLAGEMADEVLGSRRVLPKRAMEAGYVHSYADLLTALSQILGKL